MAAIKTIDFLPQVFRTDVNRKFLNATVDQLISEPQFKKVNGYIGRRFAPTYKKSDNYVLEPDVIRQAYQLEPSVVVRDSNNDIQFQADYVDLLQKIEYYGGIVNNQSRLFENEVYTFNGNLDLDKLVNFNQYYWLPAGPQAVDVFSGAVEAVKTFSITINSQQKAFNVSGFGNRANPDITLLRGGTYTFKVSPYKATDFPAAETYSTESFDGGQGGFFDASPDKAKENKFTLWIQTEGGSSGFRKLQPNISTREVYGVENNGVSNGEITFNVPSLTAQSYYATMPLVQYVDYATTIPFSNIHNMLLDSFTDAHQGFDGATANIDGKYVIFIKPEMLEEDWTPKGVYDGAYDPTVADYDDGDVIPVSMRTGIWKINLVSENTTPGTKRIKLEYIQDIPVKNKVYVTSGLENGNKEYFKNLDLQIEQVPLITSPVDTLYYVCEENPKIIGRIKLIDQTQAKIDVNNDILGQLAYTSPNGVTFTNGLKVTFDEYVTPTSYANKTYYVEGVGKGIRLVDVDFLITPELSFSELSIEFDSYNFDTDRFEQALSGPLTPDYITINRGSIDMNAWSRSNRWFHQDVILKTAEYNGTNVNFNQLQRAARPIIEFDSDLKLFNNGLYINNMVDVLDFSVRNSLNEVENGDPQNLYFNGISVQDGMTVIFANDVNPEMRNRIFTIRILNINGEYKIHLEPLANGDTTPMECAVPTVGFNIGKSYWYDGTMWHEAQRKTKINQAPLFDIVDDAGNSFGDYSVYTNTNFKGTPIFGYKLGTGVSDSVLKMPLSYRTFNNTGDIEFLNHFDTDTFTYLLDAALVSKSINTGSLLKIDATTKELSKYNVWSTAEYKSKQYQLFSYVYTGKSNNFELDILPETIASDVPSTKVYKNNKLLDSSEYSFSAVGVIPVLVINSTLTIDDKIDVLIYSNSVSNLGHYQVPLNLDLNSLNTDFTSLTLGQMRNHLISLASNSTLVSGQVPGNSNLRDVQVKTQIGNILQHSAPAVYSSLFLLDKKLNFIDSLALAQKEYTKFKHKFLETALTLKDTHIFDPVTGVDQILSTINLVKDDSFPWYYSDMVPTGDLKNVITYTVLNTAITEYEITNIFADDVLSNKAVLVYRNGKQLVNKVDFTFNKTRPSIVFAYEFDQDDEITIVEYEDTDGCYIPETPTKLGLYPKFIPEKYVDNTYVEPVEVIRGHDGSITPAFGDFRDELLLELEKRIYNNIKVSDRTARDVMSMLPGKFRSTAYTLDEFNRIISSQFLSWVGESRVDYTTNTFFQSNNSWTWNYSNMADRLTSERFAGYWRGIYKHFYDTDTPHMTPWEMVGFSVKPDWWEEYYGPAPYTGGNLVMWEDLEKGIIRGGEYAGTYEKYARPGLTTIIPVTENGDLKSPYDFLIKGFNGNGVSEGFVFGDHSPVETAWRRSSNYPFAVQMAMALMFPGYYFGALINADRYYYDKNKGQYIIAGTNKRISPSVIHVNGEAAGDEIIRTAGYINWIRDHLVNLGIPGAADIINSNLAGLSVNLSYKVGGYTDKDYIQFLAEQNSPTSTNDSIVIPPENFTISLHKSSPLVRAVYSAVIVQKTSTGYAVKGYDLRNPFFTVIPSEPTSNSYSIKILGATGVIYNEYKRAKVSIPYGFEFTTKQQVVDFLVSYGRYLQAVGFQFDEFNTDLNVLQDWVLSVKEFLTWSQQGWADGNIIVLSPSATKLKYYRGDVFVDEIENTPTGPKVLDQNFNVIKSTNFGITRDAGSFSITTYGDQVIAYIEFNLVQYEHVVVFDNETMFSDIIYKPELGNRQYRLKMIGNKTDNWAGRLEAPGFIYNAPTFNTWQPQSEYLKGDLVTYKNNFYTALSNVIATDTFNQSDWALVSDSNLKSGLLPNLATNAKRFEFMYDLDNDFVSNQMSTYSNGLIGFRDRTYLRDLSLDTSTQTKLYQGYIKEKGTSNAITALTSAKFNNLTSDIKFYEEWGIRVGEYGALESNKTLDIVMADGRFTKDPIALSLLPDNSIGVVNVGTSDYYKTPLITDFNIFGNRTEESEYVSDIKTAGYVNLDDVDLTIFDINNYTELDAVINKIGSGYKIWVAKNQQRDWDIYRINETENQTISVKHLTDTSAEVKTEFPHGLLVNEIFAFKGLGEVVDGFYQVDKITGIDTVEVSLLTSNDALKEKGTVTGRAILFKLTSLRFKQVSDIISKTPMHGWKSIDRVWVDVATKSGEWGVFQKNEPWTSKDEYALPAEEYHSRETYGSVVKMSSDGKFVVVTRPGVLQGQIRTYSRVDGKVKEIQTVIPSNVDTKEFGASLAVTSDSVVVGAPGSLSESGQVHVYQRSENNELRLRQIINGDIVGSRFGHSVAMSEDSNYLYVGAPGNNTVLCYALNRYNFLELQYQTVMNQAVYEVTSALLPQEATTIAVSVVEQAMAEAQGYDTYKISKIRLVQPGSGFTSKPDVVLVGDGIGATAEAQGFDTYSVSSISLTNSGNGYTSQPTVSVVGDCDVPAVVQVTGVSTYPVTGVTLNNPGSDSAVLPTVVIEGNDGIGATAKLTTIIVGGSVTGITLTSPGYGYATKPTVTVNGTSITNDPATVTVTGTQNGSLYTVTGFQITNAGSGYTTPPTLTISDGTFVQQTANLSIVTTGVGGTIGTKGSQSAPVTSVNNWAPIDINLTLSNPSLTVFGDMYVIFDADTYGGGVYTSLDGKNWTKRVVTDSASRNIGYMNFGNPVIKDGKLYVLATQSQVAYNNPPISDTSMFVVSTSDGVVWTVTKTTLPADVSSTKLAFNGTTFACVQTISNVNTTFVSNDGIVWSSVGPCPGIDIASNGSTFVVRSATQTVSVATATSTYMWVSSDARTWQQRTIALPAETSSSSYQFAKLCATDGTYFVDAVLTSTSGSTTYTTGYVYKSIDGISWTKSSAIFSSAYTYGTVPTGSNASFVGMPASSNGTFYRLGTTISFTGEAFSQSSSGGTITYGMMYTSTDGVTWSANSIPSATAYYTPNQISPDRSVSPTTTIAVKNKMVVVTGPVTHSVLYKSCVVTNFNVTGGVVGTATNSLTTTYQDVSYYPKVSEFASAIVGVSATAHRITGISLTAPGAGYTSAPTVIIKNAPGASATATIPTSTANATGYKVTGLNVVSGGSGYAVKPSIVINGNGVGASATASMVQTGFTLTGIRVLTSGEGYSAAPAVMLSGAGTGYRAIVDVIQDGYKLTGIRVVAPGSGYTGIPTVSIVGGNGSGASAEAVVTNGQVSSIQLLNSGYGFIAKPLISITGSVVYVPGADYTIVQHPTDSSKAILTFLDGVGPGAIQVRIVKDTHLNQIGVVTDTSVAAHAKFGASISTNAIGDRLIVGAPLDTSYDNEMLDSAGNPTDYPNAGSVFVYGRYLNAVRLIQKVEPRKLAYNAQFGTCVEMSAEGGKMFASSPGYAEELYHTGVVNYYVDRSREYLEAWGVNQFPYIKPGHSIVINNVEVVFTGTSVDHVVEKINAASIPGVVASNKDDCIYIKGAAKTGLSVIPGSGTAFEDLGIQPISQLQEIRFPIIDYRSNEQFGTSLSYDSTSDVLLVGSRLADIFVASSYDKTTTVFDNRTTVFYDRIHNSGAVYVYELLQNYENVFANANKFGFIQQLKDEGIKSFDQFGKSIDIANGYIIASAPYDDSYIEDGGKVYGFANLTGVSGWQKIRKQSPKVEFKYVNRMFLYNTVTQTVIANLDYIDPAKGKILGIAEQDIDYKTTFDPAVYTNTTHEVLSQSSDFHWSNFQVGQIWWNLDLVRFLDYEQDNLTYRLSNWGKIFPGSYVEVLEWVESEFLPSQYVANGGDGVPKYADDSAYVEIFVVNPVTGVIQSKYYYWVRDKKNNTTSQKRRPVSVIADIIKNPQAQQIPYAAVMSSGAVGLFNYNKLLDGKNVVLRIDYSNTLDKKPIHVEYELIQENNDSLLLPKKIVNKLIDSLSGKDASGRNVPDVNLLPSERYGISIRPRQSMFVNKFLAAKNFTTFVNSVCIKHPIAEQFNISKLHSKDPVPTVDSYTWDISVETRDQLAATDITQLANGTTILIINDNQFEGQWSLHRVVDGSLVLVTVGYITVQNLEELSYLNINEYPVNLRILVLEDSLLLFRGWVLYKVIKKNVLTKVTSSTWDQEVSLYSDLAVIDPNTLPVGYKIKVISDINNHDNVSIYEVTGNHDLKVDQTQNYDVSVLWNYADWYAEGYNRTVSPTYIVDTEKDILKLSLVEGDIIRVRNNGNNQFVIYQIDKSLSKVMVGLQRGTIQFTSDLYNDGTHKVGFGSSFFGEDRFDLDISKEFRIIVEALRDDIFVKSLKAEFNKLFFVMMNYILSEKQINDWLFKTSFVSVEHNLRKLEEYPNYIKDNQDYYSDYISEVKPYRTKVREYLIKYDTVEESPIVVSDFDLPSYYDSDFKVYRSPNFEHARDEEIIKRTEYQDWNNFHTYTIGSVVVCNPGTGYAIEPVLTVEGGGGTGAKLRALIDYYSGAITQVIVENPGSGYTSTPVITINGSGEGAKVYPIMENSKVRAISTSMKFDRVSYTSSVIDWAKNLDLVEGDIVTYKGVAYTPTVPLNTGEYFDFTKFKQVPAADINNANDRVMAYYQPTVGMAGRDLTQIFEGVRFIGNEAVGMNFGEGSDSPGQFGAAHENVDVIIRSSFLDDLGVEPDTIVAAGGDFIDRSHSHAPEELVPGLMCDTLEMRVFTLTNRNVTLGYRYFQSMMTNSEKPTFVFTTDGVSTDFTLLQDPNVTFELRYFRKKIQNVENGNWYASITPLTQADIGNQKTITISTFDVRRELNVSDWTPWTDYTAGTKISYGGKTYVVTVDHNSDGGFIAANYALSYEQLHFTLTNNKITFNRPLIEDEETVEFRINRKGAAAEDSAKYTFKGNDLRKEFIILDDVRVVKSIGPLKNDPTRLDFNVLVENDRYLIVNGVLTYIYTNDEIENVVTLEVYVGPESGIKREYFRISEENTSHLAKPLAITDKEIFLTSVATMPAPSKANLNPGVVFINGERITYYGIDYSRNALIQIRRGTAGTGAPQVHAEGSIVSDGSLEQVIADADATTWLNPSTIGYIVDGQGLDFSSQPQALFIKARNSYTPWLPPADMNWVDPTLLVSPYDGTTKTFDRTPFDSYNPG